MAIYAVGDIQGCDRPLQRLLERLRFDPGRDRLWLAGDLVNRGPDSLAVLRRVRGLGTAAVVVLGNHDLNLLAVAEGLRPVKHRDTFHTILEAPDRVELLDWLRHCPLLHHDDVLGFTMIHAGLPPQWDLQQSRDCAAAAEAALRGPHYRSFLAWMFGSEPRRWQPDLQGMDRFRFTINCLTRMRFCQSDGTLNFSEKGPPGSQPRNLLPWFELPGRRSADMNILFGHWASLGHYRAPGIWALDSGCAWGGCLTAVRLDAPAAIEQIDCSELGRG